jgi:hypothetical protein
VSSALRPLDPAYRGRSRDGQQWTAGVQPGPEQAEEVPDGISVPETRETRDRPHEPHQGARGPAESPIVTSGPARRLRRAALAGGLLATLGALMSGGAATALADRAATAEEVGSMLAAVRGPAPDPAIELAATTARISTINGRWAYADVSGTYRGEQLQGARYVLRRADPTAVAWDVATVDSSLGGCRFMRGLGMPAAVVDDLGVSHEISYSCVNPPKYGLIDPETLIENYDRSASQARRDEKFREALREQARDLQLGQVGSLSVVGTENSAMAGLLEDLLPDLADRIRLTPA